MYYMKNNGHGSEKEILERLPHENTWEQIMYEVVAMNNLDPWDLDIAALSVGFSEYIKNLEDPDFRIPAKWVIIAAILLRMKSDYIKIMKMDADPDESGYIDFEGIDDAVLDEEPKISEKDVDPMEALPKRKPVRSITITDLVDSLRKVLATEKRRDMKIKRARGKIKIKTDDIGARIEKLYSRITGILERIDEKHVPFSKIVGKWERENVVNAFMPLIHLDNQKKVECLQKDMFDEILIKKR